MNTFKMVLNANEGIFLHVLSVCKNNLFGVPERWNSEHNRHNAFLDPGEMISTRHT